MTEDTRAQALDSSEAQALEEQIRTQTLTDEESRAYFGTGAYAGNFGAKRCYATTSQIKRLAHKSRTAVKGLNPWQDDGLDFYYSQPKPEPLTMPEPKVCEFCGAEREYLGLISHNGRIYEWEVERWSNMPQRCGCEEAVKKREEEAAERKRLEEEERQRREAEARRERIEKQLADSGMKKRFLARRFENFVTDTQGRKSAYRTAKEYADNFEAHKENGDGLYIEGTFGTGKTHLAAAIAIQLMEQGHGVIFKTSDDLLRDIKATFDENGREEQKVLDRMKRCELLVIDDIGKEQATDWSTAQLYAIINDRYECQRPVIITTNFNENDLIEVESPKGVGTHRIKAILSRLHETCGLMTMDWQDWRGNG